MIVGAGTAAVGALVKFGDEKVTVTSSGVDYDAKSYNLLNYTLMVFGGVIFIAGLASFAGAKSSSRAGVSVDWKPDGSAYLGLSCRF
jgi:hypothetical protein